MDRLIARAIRLAPAWPRGRRPAGTCVVDGAASRSSSSRSSPTSNACGGCSRPSPDKARLVGMLNQCIRGPGVRVLIGEDSDLTSELDFSLVATAYGSGDQTLGSLAVVRALAHGIPEAHPAGALLRGEPVPGARRELLRDGREKVGEISGEITEKTAGETQPGDRHRRRAGPGAPSPTSRPRCARRSPRSRRSRRAVRRRRPDVDTDGRGRSGCAARSPTCATARRARWPTSTTSASAASASARMRGATPCSSRCATCSRWPTTWSARSPPAAPPRT